MIEGRGWKVIVCLHWTHLLSPVGSGICKTPVVVRQNSQRRNRHIRYWSSMRSMLSWKVTYIWLKFSHRQLDGLWNFWRWKNLEKNLKLKTTTVKGPRSELNFIFHSPKSQRMYLLIRLERFSFERRKVIGFAITMPHDWLKKLAPHFHPIRRKTKTNRDSLACVFPRFASATCNYYEFWLAHCNVYGFCDWLE